MRVGILVDGQAEYKYLPRILNRVSTTAHTAKVIYCDMQPLATPRQIAYVAAKRIPILWSEGATYIIVLLDKEGRADCTYAIAAAIERELINRLPPACSNVQINVVLKVQTFENWLIADPQAIASLKEMFRRYKRIEKAVVPDKADHVDALALLKECATPTNFDKMKCAKAICEKLDPDRAARNSRSFRRFLRVIGHPDYSRQSRVPLAPAK